MLLFVLERKNSRQILISVETAFVFQFSYYSLITIGQLNPMFQGLANGLKYSNGYDIILSPNRENNIRSDTPIFLLGIGIESVHFSDNVNISLSFVVLCIVVGFVCKLIHKLKIKSL